VVFADNLSSPEGPVLLSDGSWLLVEMGPDRGCVTHISPDGRHHRSIAKTGRPNGLAVDQAGIIWVAESQNPPSLLTVTMDGDINVFMSRGEEKPFLFPNDLAFGPDGALYMTDSGISYETLVVDGVIRPDFMDLKMDGRVFKIDRETKAVTTMDSGLRFTNGIAFGPDGSLYINETLTGMVYRYGMKEGRVAGVRESFGNVIDPKGPGGFRGPDGMAFGENGHLFVAVYGQGIVTELDPDGSVVRYLPTKGLKPTNVAFGPRGEKRIYVTEDESGSLDVIDVDTDGFPLFH
jgi:gluconolactonase